VGQPEFLLLGFKMEFQLINLLSKYMKDCKSVFSYIIRLKFCLVSIEIGMISNRVDLN
jgi:hypothetical protein